jgi:hypothetical protein
LLFIVMRSWADTGYTVVLERRSLAGRPNVVHLRPCRSGQALARSAFEVRGVLVSVLWPCGLDSAGSPAPIHGRGSWYCCCVLRIVVCVYNASLFRLPQMSAQHDVKSSCMHTEATAQSTQDRSPSDVLPPEDGPVGRPSQSPRVAMYGVLRRCVDRTER